MRGGRAPSSGVHSPLVGLRGLALPPPSPGWTWPSHVEERILAEELTDLSSNPSGNSVSISDKWGAAP